MSKYSCQLSSKRVGVGKREVAWAYGKYTLIPSVRNGEILVFNSDAERQIAHMLYLAPRARQFQTQHGALDLMEGNLLLPAKQGGTARRLPLIHDVVSQ